ncbi:MAG: lipoprotein [Rubrivivax sp.]|nr:lipoprotein [Rubrivivax sp.]
MRLAPTTEGSPGARTLIAVLVILGLAACGQKGPLTLPQPPAAAAASAAASAAVAPTSPPKASR